MTAFRSEAAANDCLLETLPEHLKVVGLIAVNHAHLDRSLCRLLSCLAGLDPRAAHTLLSAASTNALRGEIVSNLVRRRSLSHESMAQLDACLARVKHCTELKGEMIDSAYGIGREGLVLAPGSDRCGEIMPFTIEKLRDLADDLAGCAAELDRLASAIRPHEGSGPNPRAKSPIGAEVT